MNGRTFPPIGKRERMQFITVDVDATVVTYSRGCTASRGDYVLVRVPLDADGEEDRSQLTEDELRFVQHNITAGEWSTAATIEGARNGNANVSGSTVPQEGPGRGDQPGSGDQDGDRPDGKVGDDTDTAGGRADDA